jgi:hypothetical protein
MLRSRPGHWRLSILAVSLAGLLLGTCLTALAEAAFPTARVCAAAQGEEVSLSKPLSPSLWAVGVEPSLPPRELPQPRYSPLDLTEDFLSVNLGGDFSSRAPPTLL